ncbi:MAG: lytic transglycosylase domain-containing protein [Acidobacteria bacterium]|nr:lytic transglycosylase domain-containing protein [Acidobacteriota bacterium]
MRSAFLTLVLLGSVLPLWAGGFSQLARQGRWNQILELARIRSTQLPLTADEALIAAEAARHVGDRELEAHYLEAVPGDCPAAGPVQVRLASFLFSKDRSKALELALAALKSTRSSEVRDQAVDLVARVARDGLSPPLRRLVARRARRLPRNQRRRLQLALATSGGVVRREPLRRLLRESVADLPALEGARALLTLETPTAQERWLAAQALYRHAAYEEAAPLLEELASRPRQGVPAWQVLFVRGRCEFRRGQWSRAVQWYRRAKPKAPSRERLAELEIHVARALELAGDLDGALREAGAAVRHRPSDERRLFLLRLTLRSRPDGRAKALMRKLRRRTSRDRARVLSATAAHRRGDRKEMLSWLGRVRRRPWRAPACVLAAQAAAQRGDSAEALRLLESAAAAAPSDFWTHVARRVMGDLPAEEIDVWRASRRREVAGSDAHRRRWEIDRWAVLESDPQQLAALRALAVRELGLNDEEPSGWRGDLARTLWQIGLEGAAARWDPAGFPGGSASEAAWSAPRLLANGEPRWALRRARAVADRLGWHAPPDLLPAAVQRALFPLSWERELREVAAASGVPWNLLAAVVREESRWDPDALSVVGARGLTQLMPATAAAAAAAGDSALPEPQELFDPEVSLRLGAAELARLLGEFEGRRAPAVAAYNAGEAQARLWLEDCGADCTEEWYVLGITFSATRRYTEDVLAAAQRYDQLYRERPHQAP